MIYIVIVFLWRGLPPVSTRTDTLFPYPTLVRSVIGVGMVSDAALMQRNIDGQAEMIVAERPTTTPDSPGHALLAGCATELACPGFMAVPDSQRDIQDRKSVGLPIAPEFRSGRTTAPISPPPKPTFHA